MRMVGRESEMRDFAGFQRANWSVKFFYHVFVPFYDELYTLFKVPRARHALCVYCDVEKNFNKYF